MKKKSSKKAASLLTHVPLKFHIPNAASVRVSGSFNNWDQTGLALTPASDGAWTLDLDLALGRYEYRLIVDGEWIDVPGATDTVENPYGGRNAVLTVGPPS